MYTVIAKQTSIYRAGSPNNSPVSFYSVHNYILHFNKKKKKKTGLDTF